MNLNEFKNSVYAGESRHGNRSMDYCYWYFDKTVLFQERTYNHFFDKKLNSPAKLFHFITTEPKYEYWGDTIYTVLELANKEAKKYGAVVQKGFYCDDDNPYWFLIFNDLDKAIEYSWNQIKNKINYTEL